MHIIKAKQSLMDYFDLNRRYMNMTDAILFEDEKVVMDIIPKFYFAPICDKLLDISFITSPSLRKNCSFSEISDCFALNEHSILSGINEEFSLNLKSMDDASVILERQRYKRLNRLIDSKFTDEKLIVILNFIALRKDSEIQKLITDNADIPTIFEYVLGILWYKISHRQGKILDYMKLSLDANLLPKTHAAGGEADIVYEYEKTAEYPAPSLLLEATLADKNNQRRMEMEPVSRHLGNHIIKTQNFNSYCVFATNNLNINVVSDFKGRKYQRYYNTSDEDNFIDGMKIIPLQIDDLKNIIESKIGYEKLYKIFEIAFQTDLAPREWRENCIVKKYQTFREAFLLTVNGARALLESLKQENVEITFGYPGGVVLKLYDEVYKMKFPHILTGHEQGAVHAADGYARASGKVGVVFATSGPGAANLITGIATANMDSVPLVCITGQVANHAIGKDSFQEVDVSGITTPITKHNYLITNAKDIPRVIKEAFFIARTGRPGPVVIDIAADVFNAEIDFSYPDTLRLPGYNGKYPANADEIAEAVKLLETSERPVIFFGGGVISSNTFDILREIVEYLNVPVTSTLMGIGGVATDTDGYLGFAGMHGAYGANMAIQNSDLVLAVGMRFSDRVTGKVAEFAPNAKKIHFEIDLAEINKNVTADLRVLGDLRESLPLFKEKLFASNVNFKEKFADWKTSALEKAKEHPFGFIEDAEIIKPGEVIEKINEAVNGDAIFVTDVGQHQMWAAQFCKVKNPREFLTSGGLGTMGFGLPAALGAKLAKPNKKVILLTGDGSFMMNVQELVTAAENAIDVKAVIFHNGILGMVGQWQRLFYENHYSASLLDYKRDFVKIAEAMGVKGIRIDKKEDLSKLPEILNENGAVVIDVIIPKEENVIPMVPGGKRLDEMVLGK